MIADAPPARVADAALVDLRERLERCRWPTPWPGLGREAGISPDDLHRLVDRWRSTYDWRSEETALRALPWGVARIGDQDIRYLIFDAERPGALPVVVTHGWPSTVLELVALARRLSTPSQHGGNAEDAFTVVVPGLPGFALSPQQKSLLDAAPIHELWHRLMTEELGFTRYGAHGGDLGAGVTSRLGQTYPQAVVGIHLLAVADPPDPPSSLTAEEASYLAEAAAWTALEGAYEHQQQTRPMTLSYGLADSPVGLLAWLLEKYRAWTDGDGLGRGFTDDFVLTQASLYWFTNAISTSFRPYFEHGKNRAGPIRHVGVPTAVAIFPADLVHPPRSWAERTYNVKRFTHMPRGGHFAAHEEPALLGDDITEFFRPLR